MPRVKFGIPQAQLDIEENLRKRYGGMLTQMNIVEELGITRPSAALWLEDVPSVLVNCRKKYSAANVAKKIYENTKIPA